MSPRARSDAHLRARRWDVLVLGSALPGLVAAARLAMTGLRVLVAEEEASSSSLSLLREPFLLPGVFGDGIVDACLRELAVALIERRSLVQDEVAYQVLLPDARVDVGDPLRTAEEWVAWGLAKPEEALALVRELDRAARAEQESLMEADLVRRGLRALAVPGRSGNAHQRGLPEELGSAGDRLKRFLEVQARALAGQPPGELPPAARARLLGAGLAGAGSFQAAEDGLRALLRRRLRAVHVEFRTLSSPFRMVELGDHPGIARIGPDDVWLGRALVLNAPSSRIAAALRGWGEEPPPFLDGPLPGWRRLAIHLRALQEVVPDPLGRRAILVDESDAELPWVSLAMHPSRRGGRFAELVAAAVVPDDPGREDEMAARIEARVQAYFPFSEGRMKALARTPRPLWDDDAGVFEPVARGAWPQPLEIRATTRRPVYRLPREELAPLGVEGDLLLGWRAGDAIRADLS